MNTLTYVVIFSLAGGVFSLIGGLMLLVHSRVAKGLASFAAPFAAGAMLGVAFLDLLPEALELKEAAALNWALGGMVLFFLLERFLHWFHHHHEHGQHNPAAVLVIVGDTIHNAIDGIAIGAAFLVSVPTGIVTTIAVAAHEIPQEVGDFGLLLKMGLKKKAVILVNLLSAVATVITAVATFELGEHWPLGGILALTAGLFIYIASSDIIPTIHMSARKRFAKLESFLLLAGIAVVWIAVELTHIYIG